MARALTVRVKVNGRLRTKKFKSLKQAASFVGYDYMRVYMRITKLGWTPEQALRVPVNPYTRRDVIAEDRA